MQYTSNQMAQIWQSFTDEEKDWCIVAACLGTWWAEWPGVERIAKGVPDRVNRLKALGNAQVPLVAASAWSLLTEDLHIQENRNELAVD